jgi:hypothetical protein
VVKKIVGWVIVILLIFYVVRNPTGAAAAVKSVGAWIAELAAGIGDFFTRLVSG